MTSDQWIDRWRAHRATWMEQPHMWVSKAPSGAWLGPGTIWASSPGAANLLWLAMDVESPPANYDARANGLYTLLLLFGHRTTLAGLDLFDQAGALTLEQFHQACISGQLQGDSKLSTCLPVIAHLAYRRIANALT